MTIKKLHKVTAHVRVSKKLAEFDGKVLAVDASMVLHRAAAGAAMDLLRDPDSLSFLKFPRRLLAVFSACRITLHFVFDGRPAVAKSQENEHRKTRRDNARALAKMAQQAGDMETASKHAAAAISITPQMSLQLMKVLNAAGVLYTVAPSEADSQLAYLSRENLVDAILCEDGDLLVLGSAEILTKLVLNDTKTSTVHSLELHSIFSDSRVPPNPPSPDCLDFTGFSQSQFLLFGILCGCDFLPNVKGIGPAKAYGIVTTHENPTNIIRYMKTLPDTPPDYAQKFLHAVLAFTYPLVYDPRTGKLTHLTPLPAHLTLTDEENQIVGW
ncbi:PIN domain-like protein [Mycena latifolia]|nr:PIN domain-like protein [Mycena latifolia]